MKKIYAALAFGLITGLFFVTPVFGQQTNVSISAAATSGGSWSGTTVGPYTFTPAGAITNANIINTDIQNRLLGAGGFTAGNVTIVTANASGTGAGNLTTSATITAATTTTTQRTFTITAGGSITISNAINFTPANNAAARPGTNISFSAGGSISISAAISTSGGGYTSATLIAGQGGSVSLTAASGSISIVTAITANGGAATSTGNGDRTAGAGGDITLTATTGNVSITNTITTNGGTAVTTGSGVHTTGAAGDVAISGSTGITLTANLTANGGTGGDVIGADGNFTMNDGNGTVTSGGINDGQSAGVISGGSLTKLGAGSLTLSGFNTYSGITNINVGIIKYGQHGIAASGPLGAKTSGTIVANNAALDLAGYSETGAEALTLNGDGPYPSGALRNSGGADTYSGPITLASASSIAGVGAVITINSATPISGAFDLTLTGPQGGILTSQAAIGIGTIIKSGAGTWTLSASNTHTGGVTLNAGTLNVNNIGALGNTATGTFTINSGTFDNTTGANITTPSHPLAFNGDFTYAGSLGRTLNLGTGIITMSADRLITVAGGTLTAGGILNQGTLSLAKAGTGIFSFGANAVTLKNMTISAGTLVASSVTTSLAGDFSNSSTFTHSNGTVNFNGSVLQSIAGSTTTTFYNLTANNSAGVATTGITLQSAATIANILTLTSGHITTTSNLLTMNSGSSVFGQNYASRISGGSDNSFVNGPLKKIGNSAFLFPVGKIGAGQHFCGISAAGAVADTYTAQYFRASAYTQGNIGNAGLKQISNCEYWDIATTVGAPNRDVILSWSGTSNCNAAVYVNDITTLVVAHFASGSWNTYGGLADAGSLPTGGSVTWMGVTTFSPFTLGSTSAFVNPLPVKLVNAKAYRSAGMNKIEWTNMTEADIASYEVERSMNGFDFTSIASISARSNNNTREDYSRLDMPAGQTIYYRIKVIANDGMISYSMIVKVADKNTDQLNLVVYPNPVVGKQFTLELNAPAADYILKVFGANGQMIKAENIRHPGGPFTKTIELPEHLPAGQYYLQVTGGETILNSKIIVQ